MNITFLINFINIIIIINNNNNISIDVVVIVVLLIIIINHCHAVWCIRLQHQRQAKSDRLSLSPREHVFKKDRSGVIYKHNKICDVRCVCLILNGGQSLSSRWLLDFRLTFGHILRSLSTLLKSVFNQSPCRNLRPFWTVPILPLQCQRKTWTRLSNRKRELQELGDLTAHITESER